MSNFSGVPIPVSGKGIAIPGREGEYIDPRTLSTTPGGTIFGTTPGGTRIVYNREALMALQNSPLARTPPIDLPNIPGVTIGGTAPVEEEHHLDVAPKPFNDEKDKIESDGMFSMD